MNRPSRIQTLAVILLVVGALLACKKLRGESSDESSSQSSGAPTAAGDSTGIPECDEFLTKYKACVDTKMPAAARPGMDEAIKKMRETYKTNASTPAAKTAMAGGCKQALESTKQAMAQYNCTW